MNILFVNYGDFTTNSLNHIGGFANTLCARGHACVVAVPAGKETLGVISGPQFIPATYGEVLAQPGLFPDGKPADLIHAWTPREVVRKFVLAYQRAVAAPARVLIHLEDNEDHLIERYTGRTAYDLRGTNPAELATLLVDSLPHPWRHQNFLRVADGVTVIVESLRQFAATSGPVQLLPPGVDFTQYHPQAADPALRRELGLQDHEKVIVFTGSTTFANEDELLALYAAVGLLNQRGTPTRLVRTGFPSPGFAARLDFDCKPLVLELGFVAKPLLPRLLALADVLVQPGQAGPFNDFRLPSKLPEFLASGRPVILPATNIAALMKDGREALFLRSGSAEEIAGLCLRVFADPSLGRRLGEAGSAFARKHFDLATNTEVLLNFYATVRQRPALADWSALRTGAISEISLLAPILHRQIATLPPGSPAAALAAQLESLTHQLAQFEQAADASHSPQAALAARASEAETRLAVATKQVETLDKRLGLTLQHADNLEKILAATRAQLKLAEDSAHRKAGVDLEKLRDLLQRRVTELDEQLAGMTLLRNDREAKIRAMQESFSWQATAPLRWLRRKFLDSRRKFGRPTQAPIMTAGLGNRPASTLPLGAAAVTVSPLGVPIWHSVDHPQGWTLPPRKTLLRGWCFADDDSKLTAVRAVLAGRTAVGTYGLKRLDVLAAMRGKTPAEYCGWKIEVEFTVADTRLDLEAADENGVWHRFFHAALRVGEGLGPVDLTSYEKWIVAYDTPTAEELQEQTKRAGLLARQPLISVIMPVYNPPERWLRRAIDSVRAQSYPHWELCIADDASSEPHVRPLLQACAAADPRIKVSFREKNGHIAAASNTALALASGEFTALLDHDDELAPNALFEVAAALNTRPDTDYLYSDEDKIDEEGRRFEPYFKPDFLPDLFVGQNYTSHLSVYRAALVRQVGGFRVGFEGSQDWDLTLRIVEQTSPDRIVHVPRVLYHWRAIPGSTALVLSEKSYPVEAARRALTDHFARIGQPVELIPVPGDHWRVKYPIPSPPPLVSLIVPTRNGLKFLRRCVESILANTSYPNREIIIVDNQSDDPATRAWLREIAEEGVRVLSYPQPFNYSAINNFAVWHARGELVGLLNNDLEVINRGWLDELVSQAARPGIGCVGAMLYFPNEAIQHAGTVLGVGGVAGHAFLDFPRGTAGRFNRARLVQNYSAVTGACLVVRKAIYEQVGGLDENELAVAFNDTDLCLKVRAAGYRNLWTPFAELYHHESATRGSDDTPEKEDRFRREVETMMRRWGPELTSDPAYNPNLTLELNDFSLAAPPRIGRGTP